MKVLRPNDSQASAAGGRDSSVTMFNATRVFSSSN